MARAGSVSGSLIHQDIATFEIGHINRSRLIRQCLTRLRGIIHPEKTLLPVVAVPASSKNDSVGRNATVHLSTLSFCVVGQIRWAGCRMIIRYICAVSFLRLLCTNTQAHTDLRRNLTENRKGVGCVPKESCLPRRVEQTADDFFRLADADRNSNDKKSSAYKNVKIIEESNTWTRSMHRVFKKRDRPYTNPYFSLPSCPR